MEEDLESEASNEAMEEYDGPEDYLIAVDKAVRMTNTEAAEEQFL